ncbi:hypothetical protein [Chryseobacterium sp. EO14]|uniref:hypothetical protein n=1 Tax=Chryseobacterium sp. EO14 TaxID=2950551 RepID=UPI00210AA5BB|nr:hypothetical protein [Chryseobacterium sp. EO14]MCQ4138804.1 hypothetical protein [Chryseobacterium sp. EO14]
MYGWKINEDNDLTILQSPQKKSNLAKETGKGVDFDHVVIDLSFTDGVKNDNGGCTFKYIASDAIDSNILESTACFGPNAIYQNNYLIRGYGKPRRPMYGENFWGVLLKATNKGREIINRGVTELINDDTSKAISIEYPFEKNFTYQVILTTEIKDFIYATKNDPNRVDYGQYDVDESEAFPTVIVELKSTPDIIGPDPCSDKPSVPTVFTSEPNYYKKQKAEITNRIKEKKDFIYNFSILESKNGLLIYFIPEKAERGASHVPQSDFQMDLKHVKVIKKSYDPAYYIPTTGLNNNPCPGYRTCP